MLKMLFEREIGRKNSNQIENYVEDYLAEKPFHTEIEIPCPGTRCTYNLCTSNDGKFLASLHGNHNVVIMEVSGLKPFTTLIGHPRSPWSAAFHPLYSNIIVTGCIAGHVIIWKISNINRNDSQILDRFVVGDNNAISAITFHSSGKYLFFSSMNCIYYWSLGESAPTKCNRYSHKIKYLKLASHDTCLLVGFKLPEVDIYNLTDRYLNELDVIEIWFRQLTTCLRSNRKDLCAPNWNYSEYVDVRSMIRNEMTIEQILSVLIAYFHNRQTAIAQLISKYYDDIFIAKMDEMLDASAFTLKMCDLIHLFLSQHPYKVADFRQNGFAYFVDQACLLFGFMRPSFSETRIFEPLFFEGYLNLLFARSAVVQIMPMLAYIHCIPLADDFGAEMIAQRLFDEYRRPHRGNIDFLLLLCLFLYTVTKMSRIIDYNLKTYTKSQSEHYLKCSVREPQSISRVECFQLAALKYNIDDFLNSNQQIEFRSEDAVAPLCNLNSSTSVCVSNRPQSNRNFVAVILFNHSVGVYSLNWQTLGHFLYKLNVEMLPITLALSPSNRYLMIAGRSFEYLTPNMIHTFSVDNLDFHREHEYFTEYKVNAISFLQTFADGLVVGVNNEGIIYFTFRTS